MAETALTSRWWTLAALTIFVLFLLPIALPVLEGGPTRVVARQDRPPRADTTEDPHWDRTTKADLRFVIW